LPSSILGFHSADTLLINDCFQHTTLVVPAYGSFKTKTSQVPVCNERPYNFRKVSLQPGTMVKISL